MKKIFPLSVLVLFIVIRAFSQNMLTYETNAYLIGDQNSYAMVKNINEVNEGNSGADVIWNFTYLTSGDSLTSYLLDATQQEGYENFSESNIVIRENGIKYFFSVSPTGMEEYGYIASNLVLKYDNPIKRFSFPFIYGENLEGPFSGEYIGLPNNHISGIYKSEIDGFGTLILPDNIVYKNVLRIRTSKKNDNLTAKEVSYRWYLKNTDPVLRYPLLSIYKIESETNSFVRRAGYHIYTPGLVEKTGDKNGLFVQKEFNSPEVSLFKLKIYPNPFIQTVTVDYELPEDAKVTIVVSDILGRKVEKLVDKAQKAGNYTAEFKENGASFVYFITTFIDGKIVNSKKLIHVKK
ncbi:MAG TPA: T9SS type A sorting domain-containing protein [Draconibacterium sp.]|nr:T9SS type A sorting domain-containing protein [Draconibacterium sp.]